MTFLNNSIFGYFLLIFSANCLFAFENSCPRTFKEWSDWRRSSVQSLLREQYRRGIVPLQFKIESCSDEFKKLGDKGQCFDNMARFIYSQYQVHVPGFSMGLTMSDDDYLEQQRKLAIGTLPPEFLTEALLKRLDNTADLRRLDIVEALERLGPSGTIAFPYRSLHISSVDKAQSKDRMYLYIPGDRTDIVAQYSIGLGKKNALPNTISVITIVKKDANGNLLQRPQAYFNDLWRIRGEKFSITNRLTINKRMESCHSCHKSAFIPIVPDPKSFHHIEFSMRLNAANSIMSSYSNAEIVGARLSDLGPGMGVRDAEKLDCIKRLPLLQDLAPDLNCQDCHDGDQRGQLNFPSGLDNQLPDESNLVKLFVRSYQLMPPLHSQLSSSAVEAIYQCLIDDYYGNFKDVNRGRFNQWLLQEDCHVLSEHR